MWGSGGHSSPFIRRSTRVIARWSGVLVRATVMAFSLFACFFSTVTGFVAVAAILIVFS